MFDIRKPRNDTIDVRYDADAGIAVEVFAAGKGKFGVRLIDLDSEDVLPSIRFFPDRSGADAYAARCA